MGGQLSAWFSWIYEPLFKDKSILILGLDNAGKTVVLYCLKLNEALDYTIPTIGFNAEEIELKGLKIRALDLGGQCQFREMWEHYFEDASGVVFVVDSCDRNRFSTSSQELLRCMTHPVLKDKPFLILANKQDLPNAASKQDIIREFNLESMSDTHTWHVVECCAKQNERIHIGVQWIVNYL